MMRPHWSRTAAALAMVVNAGVLAEQSPETWVTSPAVKALYEQARNEREVVLWGPQDREVDWIAAEFGKRFPGIKVIASADRAANTKAITEQRAGRYAVDVLTFSLGGLLPLADRKMLGSNDWSLWNADARSVWLDGSTAGIYNLVYTIVYNETLVKRADLPRTWEDLLAPQWKGKLVASQFLLPRLLGFFALEWGEAKATAYAKALLDQQDTLITRSPREVILQRGERQIAIAEFVSASLYWKSQGMTIGWAPMPIMPAAQFGVTTLGRAPHPNAAKLLAGWLTTAEAKAARERLRFDADVRPGAKTSLAAQLATSGARLMYEDVPNMKARATYYESMSALVAGRTR